MLLFSLPMFLYTKPPDETTLGELLPDDHVWTDGLGGSKEKYLDACDRLIQCTDMLYVLQKNLIEKLLDNQDGNEASPSSRKLFAFYLRRYVVENSIEHRVIHHIISIPFPIPLGSLKIFPFQNFL